MCTKGDTPEEWLRDGQSPAGGDRQTVKYAHQLKKKSEHRTTGSRAPVASSRALPAQRTGLAIQTKSACADYRKSRF